MIKVVTLDPFEPKDVEELCKQLYQTFAVGCETAGSLPLPEEAESKEEKGAYDAAILLAEAETVKLVGTDKLLYLTKRKLLQPEGPPGRPPTYGLAESGGQKAVVTTALFPKLKEDTDAFRNRLAKEAIRQVGILWELHTCTDEKCAMHPSWTEAFTTHEDPILCNFCRETSEERIRIAQG